jgi:hypothetical protein
VYEGGDGCEVTGVTEVCAAAVGAKVHGRYAQNDARPISRISTVLSTSDFEQDELK